MCRFAFRGPSALCPGWLASAAPTTLQAEDTTIQHNTDTLTDKSIKAAPTDPADQPTLSYKERTRPCQIKTDFQKR